MSAKSFLRDVGGRLKNIFGVVVSAGNANAGDIPALDDTGRLDISTMPVGVTQEVSVVPASEALADGDFVNIWDNGGVAKARKADYSIVGKEACGYVLAGVAQGGNATVFHDSANTHLAGLTNGKRYYGDAANPGKITDTPLDALDVANAGKVSQCLGTATGATKLIFAPEPPVTL